MATTTAHTGAVAEKIESMISATTVMTTTRAMSSAGWISVARRTRANVATSVMMDRTIAAIPISRSGHVYHSDVSPPVPTDEVVVEMPVEGGGVPESAGGVASSAPPATTATSKAAARLPGSGASVSTASMPSHDAAWGAAVSSSVRVAASNGAGSTGSWAVIV